MNGTYDPGLYCPDGRKLFYHYHCQWDDDHCKAVVKGWLLVACQVAVVSCLVAVLMEVIPL